MPGLQPEHFMPTDHERTAQEIVFMEDAELSERDPVAFAQRVRDIIDRLTSFVSEGLDEE